MTYSDCNQRRDESAPHRTHAAVKTPCPVIEEFTVTHDTGRERCICGQDHDAITREQIVAAEMRKPLAVRERDPFPDLPGNSTVNFSTSWHRSGALLCDEAAACCTSPEELNRLEVRLESGLLRHVKAGLRTAGLPAPEWATGMSSVTPTTQEPGKGRGRPRKTDGRRGRKLTKGLTADQKLARAKNAAKARATKAAKKAAERAELLAR